MSMIIYNPDAKNNPAWEENKGGLNGEEQTE